MGSISLKNVSKVFGEAKVIPSIDLDIQNGEFVVFVGPSGCGKSTLLRLIAGLEDVTGGQIIIDGKDVTERAPAERGLAMVFQSYALYPHMSVRNNIGFPLKMAKMEKSAIDKKVNDAAAILNLTDYLDRRPSQLSGGQRQRVAIGRAIVREPSAFLFDEPLSNLDAALRGTMRLEISELHNTLKTTMIYVTHDQVEAMTMADKIVVLNRGNIEQVGSPMSSTRRRATSSSQASSVATHELRQGCLCSGQGCGNCRHSPRTSAAIEGKRPVEGDGERGRTSWLRYLPAYQCRGDRPDHRTCRWRVRLPAWRYRLHHAR